MKFSIVTLGCKVNTYESNVMRDELLAHGFHEVKSRKDDANIIIINTCTVTNVADNKSMKCVRQALRKNPEVVVVTGCMSQHLSDNLAQLGVSIVLGNLGKSKIVDYIEKFLNDRKPIVDVKSLENCSFEDMRLKHFNQTRAFVKIQDGCENFCTYCIIPYTRGPVRSKPKEVVLEEVKNLVEDGHKEIVLTGIHTGHYGSEYKGLTLASLLKELVKIDGLERIRISSIEMNEITTELLDLMREYPIIVDHMHIPLQSGSDYVLKEMHRKYNKQEFFDKLEEIREVRPLISITTDVIVGFPGETEEHFLETLETVKKMKFSKIHVFPFSKRDGTVAAELPNQIAESIKKDRVHRLIEVSKELEIAYMEKFIGETVSFLPEIEKDGMIIGHTSNYLAVKIPGELKNHETMEVVLEKIEYPYMIGGVYAKV